MVKDELIRRIAVQADVPSIVGAAVGGLRDLLGVDAAYGLIASGDLDSYRVAATDGIRTAAFSEIVITPMDGLGGRVAVSRRPMVIEDLLTDETISRDFAAPEVFEAEGLRGLACVPVITAIGVHALLYVALRRPAWLADDALDTLSEVGTHVGVAIDQAVAQDRFRQLSMLRERQRLATTLHDSVAQSLFTIGVEARRARSGHGLHATAALAEIEALAAQAGRELRETLHRINAIPEPLSLPVALAAEGRAIERTAGVTVRVVCDGSTRPLSEDHETLIIDTAREGLRNAVKHGRAQLILIHLRSGERVARLTVQSDVRRRAAAEVTTHPRGGLAMLDARARALRGELCFELGEEGEAIVRLELPHCGGAHEEAPCAS